jgi:hypothetical protein
MQRAHAEIEAVEHRITCKQHTHEDEPDEMKIESGMSHGCGNWRMANGE